MRLRDYYKQNPFALLEFLPFVLALILIWTVPAKAQEPTGKIAPAEPISVSAKHADQTPVVVTSAIDPTMPMIYPDPRPAGLAKIASQLRLIHAVAPKATKVANDEKPIVAEEPKEQK